MLDDSRRRASVNPIVMFLVGPVSWLSSVCDARLRFAQIRFINLPKTQNSAVNALQRSGDIAVASSLNSSPIICHTEVRRIRGSSSRPTQARWTSHGAYAGTERTPDCLTTPDLLAGHGSKEGYLEYLREVTLGRGDATDDFEKGALRMPPPDIPAPCRARGSRMPPRATPSPERGDRISQPQRGVVIPGFRVGRETVRR